MIRNQVAFALAWLISWLSEAQAFSADSSLLAFRPAASNSFIFDTGVLRGLLREGGKSRGLSSVVHIRTGTRLDGSVGLAGHYRVFSANRRYGEAAWGWPSEARLLPDGAVQVLWAAAPEHPFELGAVYRWTASNTLEVETSVRAQTNLVKFESFFASYFAKSFTNSMVNAREPHRSGPAEGLVRADPKSGDWLAFPRDEAAWSWVRDGRWTLPPNPVDWVRMPPLANAVGARRSPSTGVSVVISSSLKDCFAVMTPHELDPHYSMYLSLFGRDLGPGETARAKVKLMVLDTVSEAAILKAGRNDTGSGL
jgi:hypothetical protein